jgi:hypothetical protein
MLNNEFLNFGKSFCMAAIKKVTSKKAAPQKIEAKKKEIKIKYSDKSAGQPDLIPIFDEITKMLIPYAKGTMELSGGTGGKTILVSRKPVEIAGRKRDELWFASALIQKGYVGFYYMPVYTDSSIRTIIKPELLKCLKGKACFRIKKFDTEILSQIKHALKAGHDTWRKRKWV